MITYSNARITDATILGDGGFCYIPVLYRVLNWPLRRNTWQLLRALPALVVLAAAAVLIILIALERPEQGLATYREAGRQALRTGDYATAAIVYRRLALSGDDSNETRFRWAVAANQVGDASRVEAVLESLAPADRTGFVPAHLWQAQRLLAGSPDGKRIKAAEGHLRRVLAAEPKSLQARAALGQVCLATQRPTEALEHLLPTLGSRPDLNLTVSQLYAQQNQLDLATAHARRARDYFGPLAKAKPDALAPRLRWADATLAAGDPAAAAAILQERLAWKDEPDLRRALAQVYVAWSDSAASQKPDDVQTRLQLLDQALRHDVCNVNAVVRLVELSGKPGTAGAQATTALNQLLAQGHAAATVHLLLGMQARGQGTSGVAREHFEQAYRLRPELPVAANNLAWALAHAEPPDLARALDLIDSVLERAPHVASFRETRGQILARQGRWRDALTELEFALPHMPDNRILHATLANVYRRLDMSEVAREHEKIATPPKEPLVPIRP
jgi:predicted Zn-dependent protease